MRPVTCWLKMTSNAPSPRKRLTAQRGSKRYDRETAKSLIVELVREGRTITSAVEQMKYSRKTYELWRREDADFAKRIDAARQLRAGGRSEDVVRGERLGFAEWRKKYLRIDTPWHAMQWVDLLEGRDPRDLHTAQTFEQGKRNRILVNTPPFHGKSVTLTIDYAVYRLCLDPSFRILVISAGQELAADFLYGIKQRLTSPDFIELQKAYAPDGGWESTAESWTERRIVFGTQVRSSGHKQFHEKDANVLALGMRSKVYGRRADLVIVDDGVDTTNVNEHAKQLKWLRTMVESRLEAGGKLIVIGTRVAPIDLYSELRNPENYGNGVVPWTYLASPAILEEADDPADHVTLWPRAGMPWVAEEDRASGDECLCGQYECSDGFGDGTFARWDGPHLEAGPRASSSATEWALIYQQSSVAENATFPEHAIQKATNRQRICGRLQADKVGHPLGGMHDKYVIAGCDPAIKGFAAMVIYAVDRQTRKRFVLDAVNMKAPTARELKNRMQELTEHYSINEWRVEKTGLLQFFTQDAEFRSWFASRGVRFTEHLTGQNKWDWAFGVSSMAPLFGEYDKAWDRERNAAYDGWRTITEPLIEMPKPNQEAMKALVHQLLIWTPELDPGKVPCDLVMALWFAETGAREVLGMGQTGNVIAFSRGNRFVSPNRQKNRQRISLADYRTNTNGGVQG